MGRSKWVSISSEVEWAAVICLGRTHTHRRTVHLTLYLVRLISELTSLKQTHWHTSCVKPKAHLMSREESARRFLLPAPFLLSLSEKHLEISRWLTATNTGCSWYLFSCGQRQATRILHSSCQSKFKIGDDNAWEERGEYICVWACKRSRWVTGQLRERQRDHSTKGERP